MIYNLLALLVLIPPLHSLQARHNSYYYDFNTKTYKSTNSSTYGSSSSSGSSLIIGITTIFIIGVIIYFIIRACQRRRQNSNPPLTYPLQYPPQQYAPPIQQFPPQYRYDPPVASSSPTYPVLRPSQSFETNNNWDGPDYFAARRLKQNCGFCNSFSKYGEEPRIMLSCPDHHAFHLACLNQYRVNKFNNTAKGERSLSCPKCNQLIEDKVRLFCLICKERSVWLNLNQFSDDQGVIDSTLLFNKFGEYCLNCKKM